MAVSDQTEVIRQLLAAEINSRQASRTDLQLEYGEVWDSIELGSEFNVLHSMSPFVIAERKVDGARGSLMFQDSPRFYFVWKEAHEDSRSYCQRIVVGS